MRSKILFLSVLVLITATFWGCGNQSAPKKAFLEFTSAMREGNWDTVWDMLSEKSQKAFEEEGYKKMKEILDTMPSDLKKQKITELGVTNGELQKMSAKDFFKLIMKKTDASKEFMKNAGGDQVEKAQVQENKARLKIKGKNEVAVMVCEKGKWKMEFEED
ncbi:MAG: hypothetical protein RDV48_20900 [Candidatus Eremiobacteraeota bacterium]|nr:hypothetical protein [Candidatus Eremiobacteraeota bacterium]